jgi:hypothetical protein
MSADDAIAQLYRVPPGEFTELRADLAAKAKAAGDAEAAKQIAAQRKPSTAAWVVNVLAHSDAAVRDRVTALGESLRRAQAALDAESLRELSAQRRALVDELARAAFGAAGVDDPSAALRDDVTGTLQAAIADPDVAARLGRLHRAERWSGFGDVVDLAPPKLRVVQGGKAATARTSAPPDVDHDEHPGDGRADAVGAAREQLQTAVATVTAAEEAKAAADDELDDRQAAYSAARMKRDEARRRLAEAERRVADAEQALAAAKQASAEADELLKAARKQQRERREALEKARRRR